MSRRGATLGGSVREGASPAWFDLCYAMQSNRETAQMKGLDETAQQGGGCGFALGSEGH